MGCSRRTRFGKTSAAARFTGSRASPRSHTEMHAGCGNDVDVLVSSRTANGVSDMVTKLRHEVLTPACVVYFRPPG
jgi:hypothetical protein